MYLLDLLWKNRPFVIFHAIHILGIDQHRIYSRVPTVKEPGSKTFLSQVMDKESYTGHPHLSLQLNFFEKRSVFVRTWLNIHCFRIHCITPCSLSKKMNLQGKKAKGEAIEGAMKHPTKKAMESMLCKLSMRVHTTLQILFVQHFWV